MGKVGVILARFQPVHNGHIALIKKASEENDVVFIFIGSADKFNERNPIPISLRSEMLREALKEHNLDNKCEVRWLDDLTNESDNSHDWGFYLFSAVVTESRSPYFTIYYSDGFEIITSWFPAFLLKNNVSLSLLARNSVESGVSATQVRELIMNNDDSLKEVVPAGVYERRTGIKQLIELSKLKK